MQRGDQMSVLVTGAAGFFGFHVSKALLKKGYRVVGIDNLNPYYDPDLKRARLDILRKFQGFVFHALDISEFEPLMEVSAANKVEVICNLAAQAGVRYSLVDPFVMEKAI